MCLWGRDEIGTVGTRELGWACWIMDISQEARNDHGSIGEDYNINLLHIMSKSDTMMLSSCQNFQQHPYEHQDIARQYICIPCNGMVIS